VVGEERLVVEVVALMEEGLLAAVAALGDVMRQACVPLTALLG
jgi:hypothetical protein